MPGLWDPGSIGSVFIFTVATSGGDGQFGVVPLVGRLAGWDGPWHVRFEDVLVRRLEINASNHLPGARFERVLWQGSDDLWMDTYSHRPRAPGEMVDARRSGEVQRQRPVECIREIAIAAKTILYHQHWDGPYEIVR